MDENHRRYEAVLEASERVSWRVDDVLGRDVALDFHRPFLPESLVHARALPFLSEHERLRLNHIRAHGYLCTFGALEEGILPFVLGHLRALPGGTRARVRALLRFADEEAKHIELFARFAAAFTASFGVQHAIAFRPEASAEAVRRSHPLASALVTLHVEWMSQVHFIESVKDDGGIDPAFARLLKFHWIEEAQHAKLDELVLREIADVCDRGEIEEALEQYRVTFERIDRVLQAQAELDARAFEAATRRTLAADERDLFLRIQYGSTRRALIDAGQQHPRVQQCMAQLEQRLAAA
jgi:hypothetical protein